MTALALLGPTASGKSALALALADCRPEVEIVTVDAMQVYRGMDIGTAKATVDQQLAVPHHLIDLVDPHEDYAVARWQRDAREAVAAIEARGHRALLVGGTGLYLRSIVDDLDIPGQYPLIRRELESEPDTVQLHARLVTLDPTAAARMEPTNRRRIVRALEVSVGASRPFSSFGPGLTSYAVPAIRQVGLRVPREVLDTNIAVRYTAQLEAGFVDEVAALLARGDGWSSTARQALGYKELADHLLGQCSLDEAVALAAQRTRRFARRQQRWFARDPRVVWLDVAENSMEVLAMLLGEWDQCD